MIRRCEVDNYANSGARVVEIPMVRSPTTLSGRRAGTCIAVLDLALLRLELDDVNGRQRGV